MSTRAPPSASKKLEKDTLDDEKELAKMRMLQIKLEKATRASSREQLPLRRVVGSR